METKTFPVLYDNNTKSNKPRFWRVYVEKWERHAVIVVEYGFTDGKITTNRKSINKGKNIGRANETTPYSQAVSEAQSKWNKKQDAGFTTDKKGTTSKIILPMLALDYNKRGKDIIFPAYTQCKLDGVRCIYNVNLGKLQSRLGKIFPHLDHILDELNGVKINLDGELYSNTLTFQDIVGIVKKEKLQKTDTEKLLQVNYIVYDIVDTTKDFEERYKELKNLFNNKKFKYISLLKTETITLKDQIKEKHLECVSKGYEGLIIRNKKGHYLLKNRSKNLQKYKDFQDAEFKIVGFTEGTGIEKGLIIFICETPEGLKFNVRPKGTHEERKKLFKNGKKYIGKYLTVKFFELTNDLVPRFPTTSHGGEGDIRDYE